MWNPLLELLFLERASGIFGSYLVEIDLAKIALSCHFALDLLCYGHYCPWTLFISCGTICHSRGIVFFFVVDAFATNFAFILLRRSPVSS